MGFFVNVWLVERAERWLVVDTGRPGSVKRLLAGIERTGCSLRDIALIVLSHAHFDHVGGAAELRRRSGAPVAIHRLEAPLLREGAFSLSPGLNALGRAEVFIAKRFVSRCRFEFTPVEPDVLVDDEMRLDSYGFDATVIHSPGHSPGSVSVLTDGGELFAGDLAVTQPLPGRWRHMPIYGTSIRDIAASWRMLADRGAKHIYPSHGGDFSMSELTKE